MRTIRLGTYNCTGLRKIMGQHLKIKAPAFDIFPAIVIVDTMYNHPAGDVAQNVYDKQGRNALAP